jgi:Nitrate reductase delta subunit
VNEALRALAVLLEPPLAEHGAITAALELPARESSDEHTAVMVLAAPPYASVYLGVDGMLGGDGRDRVAGFWRALGGEPPAEVDHLSVLLAGIAALGEVPSAQAALFWEHVASWMPPYLATLRRIGAPFHAAWAELAASLVGELASALGPPVRSPLALRDAPVLAAPRDLEDLLAALVAPVRTGLVLVREDLARAAQALDAPVRLDDRRSALRALLVVDPAAALDWLAGEVRRQAAALVALPPITAWWVDRAEAAARWLDELAATARRG